MEVELKNLHISDKQSRKTIAFTADVHINGRKIAYARNDGSGGITVIHPYEIKDMGMINEAGRYYKSQSANTGFPAYSYYLSEWVYNLVEQEQRKRFMQKIETIAVKSLIYGNGINEYAFVTFKRPVTDYLATPEGINKLKADAAKGFAKYYNNGWTILNPHVPENIKAEIIQGIQPLQRRTPLPGIKTVNKKAGRPRKKP